MSKVDDGGPAFPSGGSVTPDGVLFEGISARDYFAAKAMASLLPLLFGENKYSNTEQGEPMSHYVCVSGLADDAYEFADAMLAARKAPQ